MFSYITVFDFPGDTTNVVVYKIWSIRYNVFRESYSGAQYEWAFSDDLSSRICHVDDSKSLH